MALKLRDVTYDFARGEAPLETLRRAARREPIDRRLADAILELIAEWENSPWPNSAWARNDLRERAKQLVPTAPPPPAKKTGAEAAASMYATGLKGHRRLG